MCVVVVVVVETVVAVAVVKLSKALPSCPKKSTKLSQALSSSSKRAANHCSLTNLP